ncbi:MAG TPA: ATP synthase F1 subunit delta [Cyclobacteriaceae bacterium]|nr:ATP synthase F1 subunit delta [Cyclobacteriaceae bacterium]
MSRVASRYVKSLLELAVEQNALDAVHADMQLFAIVCEENRAFTLMLKNPIISHLKKKEILTALFSGKVNKLTEAIFDIITRKNREALLPEIAKEFHTAFNQYKGIERAEVTTVNKLDDSLRAELIAVVKSISGKDKVELKENLNKDIVGGFLLTVNDKQIDATIKSKLKNLQLKFSQNQYLKEL